MKTQNNLYYKNYDLRKSSAERSDYIHAVNRIIYTGVTQPVKNYLDIGCGDGMRGDQIIKNLHPKFSTLTDPPPDMISEASKGLADEYINQPIHTLTTSKKYDAITCLWNVFGHIETKPLRLKSLVKIHNLLSDKGVCIIDFNNRYNVNHYGAASVFRNILKDLFLYKNRGWYNLTENSQVYIHSFKESRALIKKASLKIKRCLYVNYDTGNLERSGWSGQPVYILTK